MVLSTEGVRWVPGTCLVGVFFAGIGWLGLVLAGCFLQRLGIWSCGDASSCVNLLGAGDVGGGRDPVLFLLRALLLLLFAACFSLLHGVGRRTSGVEGADTGLLEGALDGEAGSSLQGGALVCKAGSSWDVVRMVVSAEGVVWR